MRAILLAFSLTAIVAQPSSALADAGPLPAVWKEQHLNFFYMGRTSRYSCDGLRDKMRSLLLALGARRDLQVSAAPCDDSPVRGASNVGPSVTLIFSTPVLPDAALKPLHPGDLAALEAQFLPFTLTSDAFRNFGVGDCELVEEFSRQILPKLVTRDVKRNIACVPHQASGTRYFVSGESLQMARAPSATSATP